MSYPAAPVFWIEPNGQTARGARRYVGVEPDGPKCQGDRSYHSATNWIDVVETVYKTDLDSTRVRRDPPQLDPAADYWPTKCAYCDYVFDDSAPHQTFTEEVFARSDGKLYVLPGREHVPPIPPGVVRAPAGAMYNAYWYPESWRGPDGISLMVILPNGNTWAVDTYASNCTRPKEKHSCWVRHGDPRLGDVTVDKNGDTCSAGAGSILSGDYHGFLQNGTLTAG